MIHLPLHLPFDLPNDVTSNDDTLYNIIVTSLHLPFYIPLKFKQSKRTPFDGVYKALRSKDLADCVVLATRALIETNTFIKFHKNEKSSSESLQFRIEGKEAFCEGDYQKALMKYNFALMRAPSDSEAIRLTYYNRAELLLKTLQFPACLKDIETCLALSCPDSLANKLREMKAEASRHRFTVQLAYSEVCTPFHEEFFQLKGPRNPDIPCATSDLEVIMESGKPKVVATRDIPVGTVVAVETAFAVNTNIKNQVTSCQYCLKMNFNLIPCEGCSVVMFCDKKCKDKAMQEGHNIECVISEMLVDEPMLAVRATLKIRQQCSSWDEFITASNNLGADRMKNSTSAEIFGSEKFSLLNSHYDKHFIYGTMFNHCVYFANIIHYLDTHTSFLPKPPGDKSAAIRAVSRVMMHLALYCTPVQLQHYTTICTADVTSWHNHLNKGYFPFIGNLANSCLPNCYVTGLRNSAALVTIVPVKQGAELTFSYIGHWRDFGTTNRAKHQLLKYKTVCKDCIICSEHVHNILPNEPALNDAQKKAFKKFENYQCSTLYDFFNNKKDQTDYKETCTILSALSDVPWSTEYKRAFDSFVKCVRRVVQFKFRNVVMNLHT